MRAPTRAALARWLLLLTGSIALAGCATLRGTLGGYATGSRGISRDQQRLRDVLSSGDFKSALAWRESDPLLRLLDVGAASYYAAQFARSAAALDTAALVADDRITASLSRDALAMVTNDLARPYQPRRTERLFIPYYGMLAYVRLEQWEDAAVEARRLVALLEQYADDRDDDERTLHAMLHQLAGAVFERAGERNDATVAYRAARALRPALAEADGTRPTPAAGTGELLIVVERGFVAHLATETMDVQLGADDRDSLRLRSDDRARVQQASSESGTGRGMLAMAISASDLRVAGPGRPPRRVHGGGDGYHLTIAFPALRRSPPPWGGAVGVVVGDDTIASPGVVTIVDDARAVDERRERVSIVTRAVARAAAKYAVTKAIEDRKGEVAGTLANIGASLLERADVRSWHLLPQEISLARLRLPAGPHRVRLRIGAGAAARTVDLGTITVHAGIVSITPVRLWQAPTSASVPSDSLQP